MKSFSIFIAVCLVSGCTGLESTRPSSNGNSRAADPTTFIVDTDTSLVLKGDSIVIAVWGYAEFNTRTVVKQSGSFSVPLLGEIPAAGVKRENIERLLRKRLAEYVQGDIRVAFEVYRPLPRITVLGAVGRQGSFSTSVDLPLLEVLSNAGGWNEQSDLRYIRLSRMRRSGDEAETTIEVDLSFYLENGIIRSLPMVHPGDVVFIPTKENLVRQLSEFLRDAFFLFGLFGFIR